MAILEMYRGDYRILRLTFTNTNGTPRDMSDIGTGSHLRVTAKKKFADLNIAAVFAKTDDDFTVQDLGIVTVPILPADTSGLPAVVTTLQIDAQYSNLDGSEPETPAVTTLRILPDVSQTSP